LFFELRHSSTSIILILIDITLKRLDARYESFRLFLELPKAVKTRKLVAGRIVTIEDVQNVLSVLKVRFTRGELDERHYVAYNALITFGAFTGQRPDATIGRITAGQVKEALKFRSREPTLHVSADQDKIRMAHYVPLHPRVIEAVEPLLDGKKVTRLCSHSLRSTNGSGIRAKQGTKYRSVAVVGILYSVIFVSSRSSTET
jgi:integrase